MAKNIVICLDGTHNQISGANTNVWRLFGALERSEKQVAFYLPGIGTLFDPSAATGLRKWTLLGLDLATGYTLGNIFAKAYGLLVDVYEEGDQIFLFGFSRGAYTARAVAGAIRQFGLLQKGDANLIPYLWQTYSNDLAGPGEMFVTSDRFVTALDPRVNVPIHFLGVWDTVSACGVVARLRTLPYTRNNNLIRKVRQAAAIDEKRTYYRLNRFEHGVPGQDLKQVWFAGYHSDIGGVFDPDQASLGRLSMAWMMREAKADGLILKNGCDEPLLTAPAGSFEAPIHDSMDFFFGIAELLPVRSWDPVEKRYRWHWPNFFQPRVIPPEAFIHSSVQARLGSQKAKYRTPQTLDRPQWVDDLACLPGT